MKIYLTPYLKIKDIKRNFENFFPYLKLEFFKQKHEPGQETSSRDLLPNSSFLIDATGMLKPQEIEITSRQTVGEVEQLFETLLNLPIQIYRKTRYSWVETIPTDDLTLEKQDKLGRKLCNAIYDDELIW